MLSDYQLAMGRTTTTEASARYGYRIEAIVLLTLAQMKKEAAADPRSSVASIFSTRSLHLQHETCVLMPWEFTDGLCMSSEGRLIGQCDIEAKLSRNKLCIG